MRLLKDSGLAHFPSFAMASSIAPALPGIAIQGEEAIIRLMLSGMEVPILALKSNEDKGDLKDKHVLVRLAVDKP